MSRFDIATGRVPMVSPQPPKREKSLMESLNALSEWYDHTHFQQLIDELREYCKSIPQIKIEKIHKGTWYTRISVFDSRFNINFKARPDYGMILISQMSLGRDHNITFKIEKTGKIIDADPNKSRAEIIMARLLEAALPVGPIEEDVKALVETDEEGPAEERMVLPPPDRLNENEPVFMVEQPIVINCTTNISEQTPNNG